MTQQPQAAAALRSLIVAAGMDALRAGYAADVSLVAYLAGETLHAQGRDAVCAAVARWHRRGAPIASWRARAFRGESGRAAGPGG